MGTIEFKEMWVDPSWGCPPILIAIFTSSILLAFLSIQLLKRILWLRAQATQDRVGEYLLISLFPVSYVVIGIFQFWFGGVLYSDYSDMDPSVSFHVGVPVLPVWLAGVLSAVIYALVRRCSARTEKEPF